MKLSCRMIVFHTHKINPKVFCPNFWGQINLNPVISIYTKLWIVPQV